MELKKSHLLLIFVRFEKSGFSSKKSSAGVSLMVEDVSFMLMPDYGIDLEGLANNTTYE